MENKLKELQQYLPGLESGMPKEFEKLAEIFRYQVFELCREENKKQTDYLIPYMMNDAVEDYLVLKNCRLVGNYLKEAELAKEVQSGQEVPETTAELVREPEKYVLIVHQGREHVFTLHFQGIEENVKYYQYHRIGHFWVKGQEQWRQLVYIVGTVYDKYAYMGEQACNEKEMEFLRLIEFAPFRFWSPIGESLEEKYPTTYEGVETMKNLACEAKDTSFAAWIWLYQRLPFGWMENCLSRKLLSPKREKLYELVFDKVKAASEMYPERDYGKKSNQEMIKKRKEVHQALISKGFCGTYPWYEKENTLVFVTEEHPFTLMEAEDFVFRVQFMVSECGKYRITGKNCGFFHGKHREGYILSERELNQLR